MKIMSFSQQGSRAICILSANGTISNVTLRQPSTSGGTLTYEVWPTVLCNCLCNFNIRSYCIILLSCKLAKYSHTVVI